MKEIYMALLEAKKEIGKATKNATNPHFKNKYVDINALIETVEPVLLSKGLLLLQPIENGRQYTRIIHAESSQIIESFIELPTVGTPQGIGSAITYYRRYTLQSILSMQAQDDDGQLASVPQPKVKQIVNDSQFEKAVVKYETDKDYFTKLGEVMTFTAQQQLEINEILGL